ncbi:hypothetical protein J6590_034093 [Homalodisca vitripennis]|nr:hypothetical protein J6590_034093 [Homalodisca vitripennis]
MASHLISPRVRRLPINQGPEPIIDTQHRRLIQDKLGRLDSSLCVGSYTLVFVPLCIDACWQHSIHVIEREPPRTGAVRDRSYIVLKLLSILPGFKSTPSLPHFQGDPPPLPQPFKSPRDFNLPPPLRKNGN